MAAPEAGRARSGSNRDKTKTLPNLGPESPQQAVKPTVEATGHYLVVCGATNETDGFIFSDFMGFCVSLMERRIYGTFLSCFPLRQHFRWLETTNPGVKDIKFGRVSLRDPRGVASYSMEQWQQGERWWTQVEPEQLKAECMRWISDKIESTKSGEVVNLIVEGHGRRKNKAICVGAHYLEPTEVSKLIAQFPVGVQVNFITGACFSGAIANVISASGQLNRHVAAACAADEVATAYRRSISNRVRNSRFAQAFCQSLARMKLPGVDQKPVIRLGDHENWMRQQTYRSISPNSPRTDTYTSSTNPSDINQLVEAMIFRDKVDFIYDPAITASRRRIEYPSIDEKLMAIYRKWGPDRLMPFGPVIKEECQQIVEFEATKCDMERPLGDDFGIFKELIGANPDYGEMLKALYWRGRVQTAVFDVFTVLCNRGFLDPNCLRLPVNHYNVSNPVSSLGSLLDCYEGPRQESLLKPRPFKLHDKNFESPLVWLATMILRGCADIGKLFETITLCEYLGELNQEAFEHWKGSTLMTQFNINTREMAQEKIGPCEFGFWLPHGLGDVDDETFGVLLRESVNRFNKIERMFRQYFDISKEDIWLEEEQQTYFDRAPQKFPGWKTSGDCKIPFNLADEALTPNTATSAEQSNASSIPVISSPIMIPSPAK